MSFLNEIGSWGNLNAIVYFQSSGTHFYSMVDELATHFGADEIDFSFFDLENDVAGFNKPDSLGDDVIVLAILSKGKESIHVEQLGDLCSVAHFFRPWFLEEETGSAIMRDVINDTRIIGWVLGFELSLHLQDVRKSFDAVWADPSQYPLIIFEQGKETVPKEYGAFEPMLIKLRAYLAKIS